MDEERPSETAEGSAVMRAIHQIQMVGQKSSTTRLVHV
jgi:hypothetical protein